MRKRIGVLAVLAVFTVGLALRTAYLYWSPLPATLDGFRYARLAAEVSPSLTATDIQSDELVTTLLLTAAGQVTGVRTLTLAQPFVAVAGAATGLTGMALAARTAPRLGVDRRAAALLTGFTLTVSGMVLRRTGVPDEELFAILLLPVFLLAAAQAFRTRRRAWLAVLVLLALAYPPLHNLSSLIAVVSLAALATWALVRDPRPRAAALPLASSLGFAAYFAGYYTVAERVGLELTYSGLVREYPGALLAWVCLLVVLVTWFVGTGHTGRRLALGAAMGSLFLVAAVNLVVPVFPGTTETPPVVFGLVALFVVPVGLAVWGGGSIGRTGALLAAVAGPLAVVWFALTTSPGIQFFGTVIRAQTFAHPGVFALAALVALRVRTRWRTVAVVALVLAAVASVPFAYIHLDTGTAPKTVQPTEFAAISFATDHTDRYVADHRLSRPGPLYYAAGNASVNSAREWLRGGPPPDCPTLLVRSWVTQGAHFYPLPAETLDAGRYNRFRAGNDLVYSSGGTPAAAVVAPGDCEPTAT
ncbi:sodium:phosphate symporter [Natronomonas sp. EA1]|uniref:sodium:phosphate symporter n=1 Tax=Natronomonas sp. EA1 TaxID=3421655 RepID=UPI003EC07603